MQGSYGNDTNIYSESDVDTVIQLNDCFHHDLTGLPDAEKQAFQVAHSNAVYTHVYFKNDVVGVLSKKNESDAISGEKAITMESVVTDKATPRRIALMNILLPFFGTSLEQKPFYSQIAAIR